MEVTELINVFQTHLDQALDVPVLVSGTDSRPVPSVILEDWNMSHMNRSMNGYIGSEYDELGDETARVFRIPYSCRVSLMIREHGEVASSRLFDAVRAELISLEARPQRLSDRISRVEMNSGGGVQHQFVSTTESEFNQTATLYSSLIYEDSDYDNIEEIETELDIQ
jgi:hypothetical protein